MDVHVTFGVIFATAGISAALLGIGFLLGKLSHAPPSDRLVPVHSHDLTQCWTQVALVERQADRLSELARQATLSDELMNAISRVVDSIRLIEQQLAKVTQAPVQNADVAPDPAAVPTPRPWDDDDAFLDLLAKILAEIEHMPTPRNPTVSLDSARRYNSLARIAPWVEGSFPQSSQFVTVQCQRLSAEGLLFDAQEDPSSNRLVVMLGEEDPSVYLLAEVDNHRTAIVDGKPLCRVQVRFLGRINPPPLPFDAARQPVVV